jgi:hypothetical protein
MGNVYFRCQIDTLPAAQHDPFVKGREVREVFVDMIEIADIPKNARRGNFVRRLAGLQLHLSPQQLRYPAGSRLPWHNDLLGWI